MKIFIDDAVKRYSTPPIPEIELDAKSTIRFELEKKSYYISIEGDTLNVRKMADGGIDFGRIKIEPDSSNVIHLI
jgi:hypothetical protein